MWVLSETCSEVGACHGFFSATDFAGNDSVSFILFLKRSLSPRKHKMPSYCKSPSERRVGAGRVYSLRFPDTKTHLRVWRKTSLRRI